MQKLELIPDQDKKAKPFFENDEAYQKFCVEFYNRIRPALDRDREARRRSEEAARRHLVY